MSSKPLTPEIHPRAPRESLINPPQNIASSPFTDHKHNLATSAYYGRSPHPGSPILPPQWSFHYYITSGTTAETTSTLPDDLVKATKNPVSGPYPFRIDIYFLPGASTKDCVEHYRGEKAARLSAPPPRNFIDPYCDAYSQFSVLVQIGEVEWEMAGATFVVFDCAPEEDDEEPEEPEMYVTRNVPWGDLEDFVDSVGYCLHHMAPAMGRDEMTDVYEERLRGGFSDWA